MEQIFIKDQIKKLVELQRLDGEIYSLKKEKSQKPLVLEQLKQQFESKKIGLKALEDKSKAVLLDRRQKELTLKGKEDDVGKVNAQLSQIKTNKEYTAKIHEIENIKADKSILEEKILISFDESDKVNAEIEKEKKNVFAEEQVFIAKEGEVKEEIKVIEDRITVLESQRKQIIPAIDKTHLSRYERILENKGGLAIVAVQGNTCGGCFMNVTQQTINAIKMHDQFIECEICSRILYLEEDL